MPEPKQQPTVAEIKSAYRVIQYMLHPQICLVGDTMHLIHVSRLLSEYILNSEGK